MKEKKQNEELQSRREFFKEAAKKALPIVGIIALAVSPNITHAAEIEPMGCTNANCQYSCTGDCDGLCTGCKGSCKGCQGCHAECKFTCYKTAS